MTKPLIRKPVNKKKSAQTFSKKAKTTKAVNLPGGGMRGTIRL